MSIVWPMIEPYPPRILKKAEISQRLGTRRLKEQMWSPWHGWGQPKPQVRVQKAQPKMYSALSLFGKTKSTHD